VVKDSEAITPAGFHFLLSVRNRISIVGHDVMMTMMMIEEEEEEEEDHV
jgi:hypothetical protein